MSDIDLSSVVNELTGRSKRTITQLRNEVFALRQELKAERAVSRRLKETIDQRTRQRVYSFKEKSP